MVVSGPVDHFLGTQLDGRADLYALGCVAWWLLTGDEVFDRSGEPLRILHRHIYEPVPSLRARVPGWCPPELELALAACLAKQPEDRPRDARALAAQLRAIEIPPQHAWTLERARDWWARYQPPAPAAAVATREVQVIMPGGTDRSETAIAATIRPPNRRG